jgi:predicted RNase H-like HicB family nuclease
MKRNLKLTSIIEREDSGFVSLCPELDIASQGETPIQARQNLQEALDLFFEVASEQEIERRLLENALFVEHFEVVLG